MDSRLGKKSKTHRLTVRPTSCQRLSRWYRSTCMPDPIGHPFSHLKVVVGLRTIMRTRGSRSLIRTYVSESLISDVARIRSFGQIKLPKINQISMMGLTLTNGDLIFCVSSLFNFLSFGNIASIHKSERQFQRNGETFIEIYA